MGDAPRDEVAAAAEAFVDDFFSDADLNDEKFEPPLK